MPGPTFLSGDSVTLRPVEREDLAFLRRHRNDPRVWRSLQRNAPETMADAEAWYERTTDDDDLTALLICADGDPVGYVSLRVLNRAWGNAALTVWIAPDDQGEGYATDAVRRVVAYAFDQRNLHKLLAHVFAFNDASRRLFEGVGFAREGVHEREVFVDGAYHDLHVYGLLADRWRGRGDRN